MLKNAAGNTVHVPVLHKQRQREAVLAPLREVLEPEGHKCGQMFKLGTRARVPIWYYRGS